MPHLTKALYSQLCPAKDNAPPALAFDSIVVGSGMGGLTAAAVLAKGAGERVLVLERHTVLGGCTHEFERGLEFDTGLHYVGGEVWNHGSISRRVFDYITDKRVEWARMDEAYDIAIIDGKKFPIRAGAEQFKLDLEGWFPDSKEAIAAYLKDVETTSSKYSTFIFNQIASGWVPKSWIRVDPGFGDETVDQALNRLGCIDPQLRALLTYLHGDYGATPDVCSWVQHCATVAHYLEGAAYPVGGPSSIAQAVVPVIESRGGRCITMANVVSLLVEGGRAVGVVLKGFGPVKAKKVISALGAYNTFVSLLPEEVAQSVPDLWRARKALEKEDPPSSVAHAMTFVALHGSQKDLGLPAANVWVNSSDPSDFPSVFISFPSCKDPNWQARHPNTSVCEIVVEANFDDYKQWTDEAVKQRSSDYKQVKAATTERMLAVLFKHFPALKDKVDFYESSTPLSSEHYLHSRKGTSYGLKAVPSRYRACADWLKPATALPGLYLAGQDVISCGIVGALVGGVCAASASSALGAAASRPLMIQFSLGDFSI